jgi:hypothetical protein
MGTITQVHLFGSLQKSFGALYDLPVQIDLEAPTPLPEVLKRLKIPPEMVQLVIVNHRAVSKVCMIHSGDRLSLFPKEFPIFADWKDIRT